MVTKGNDVIVDFVAGILWAAIGRLPDPGIRHTQVRYARAQEQLREAGA